MKIALRRGIFIPTSHFFERILSGELLSHSVSGKEKRASVENARRFQHSQKMYPLGVC